MFDVGEGEKLLFVEAVELEDVDVGVCVDFLFFFFLRGGVAKEDGDTEDCFFDLFVEEGVLFDPRGSFFVFAMLMRGQGFDVVFTYS